MGKPAKQLPKTRAEMELILHREFGSADARRVSPWLLPAIGLHDGRLGVEPRKLGATRFGGRPDLPDGTEWPQGPHGPLAFLGQVSLEEVAPFDVDAVLPNAGLVSFFYNIWDYAWGSNPDDRQKFDVLYTAGGVKLRRRPFPDGIKDENRIERVRHVEPYLRWELPEADPLAMQSLRLAERPAVSDPPVDPFSAKYWDLTWTLTEPHVPVGTHKLLGWANLIYQQGEDCRLICELAARGFPKEGTAQYTAAAARRSRWRCLLEISDDSELYDDTWADAGSIAFMIPEEDLKNREFSACWCVLSSS